MGPEEAFHWASQNFNSIILETYKWALWGYYLGFMGLLFGPSSETWPTCDDTFG